MKVLTVIISFLCIMAMHLLNAQTEVDVNSALVLKAGSAFQKDIFTIMYNPGNTDSLKISIADLKKYITQVIPGSMVHIKTKMGNEKLPGNIIMVVDDNDLAMKNYRINYGIADLPYQWNSFLISGRKRNDDPLYSIHFLQGSGFPGKQYACYDFIEKYLGVKFLHPEFEHIPVSKNFTPVLVNTSVQKPDFEWRGLYPWNYTWNKRGMNTFCDINYHFVNKNWDWYLKLCDWMVKNKQNAIFWFDDAWTWNNVSGQFPDSVTQYYARRGVKKMLGLGWASNSGRPNGRGWENTILVDTSGKPVKMAGWQTSISPQSPAYYPLAEKNINLLNLSEKSDNYLGVIIGYGENAWADNESDEFVKRTGVRASNIFNRDLKFVTNSLRQKGWEKLPIGFKVSSFSQRKASPAFDTDNFFSKLPDNTIFSFHTYRHYTWKSFETLYRKIDSANTNSNANMKVLHIAEVSFLCNLDIPLLRTSTLRTREAHLRTLPRQSTFCHMVTLNTTQYLYWLMSYQTMRWQWHIDEDSWHTSTSRLFNQLYGAEDGNKLNYIFEQLNTLEYMQSPDSSAKYTTKTTIDDLKGPSNWTTNVPYHTPEYGFKLWADVKDIVKLTDARKLVNECLFINESLYKNQDKTYQSEFYPTIALTLHYYGIRVNTGMYSYYLNEAKESYKKNGWSPAIEKKLLLAKTSLETADNDLQKYNKHLAFLLRVPDIDFFSQKPVDFEEYIKSLSNDFIINPSKAYFDSALTSLGNSLKIKRFE